MIIYSFGSKYVIIGVLHASAVEDFRKRRVDLPSRPLAKNNAKLEEIFLLFIE